MAILQIGTNAAWKKQLSPKRIFLISEDPFRSHLKNNFTIGHQMNFAVMPGVYRIEAESEFHAFREFRQMGVEYLHDKILIMALGERWETKGRKAKPTSVITGEPMTYIEFLTSIGKYETTEETD